MYQKRTTPILLMACQVVGRGKNALWPDQAAYLKRSAKKAEK